MTEEVPEIWQLTRERLIWVAGALTLVVLPHLPRIPIWISLGFGVFVLWRLATLRYAIPLPGRGLKLLLGVGVMAGVYFSYGSLFGRNPGVTLLVALSGMKFLEARSLRDAFVCVLLGYLLVITSFLYSQSIPTATYMFLVLVLMTGTLVTLVNPNWDLRGRERLALAASLVLQALPLSLVLFVLFPRIAGPLWGLPADAHNAVTGLSDSMSPGNISRLGRSDAIAFRVLFEEPPPPASSLYWRGPVLWQTDGRTWRGAELDAADTPAPQGTLVHYTVTLEPHSERWLFLMDVPSRLPRRAELAPDYVVTSPKKLRERLRYQASSVPDAQPTAISELQLRLGLQLPEASHARARTLAARWRRELTTPETIIAAALAYFREEAFYYTLSPPRLETDAVDEFLFESRRGFCEHYAGSFAVLMRAAGIPARVVLGYQGGEMNPLDGYLVVRQRDAHAWVEVWLGGNGWVRIDPTAAVSPARIEGGVDRALPPAAPVLLGLEIPGNAALRELWRQVGFAWGAVNNGWNQWVLGYGPRLQADLLSQIGLDARDWGHLGGALLGAAGGAFLAVLGWLSWQSRRPRERVQVVYARFCRKLARHDLRRSPSEGPLAYARRAMDRLPGKAAQIRDITDSYVRLRYRDGPGDVRELERLVAAFRP